MRIKSARALVVATLLAMVLIPDAAKRVKHPVLALAATLKGLRRRLLSILKLGGFNSLYEKMAVVNLSDLENISRLNRVSPDSLVKKS